MVLYGSGVGNITRDNWRERVASSGLTLRELAWRTGATERSVYAYSQGKRRPKDAWIESVASVLHEYANEWTCSVCLVRNPAARVSCKKCARSWDGYDPNVLRATSHGMAQ